MNSNVQAQNSELSFVSREILSQWIPTTIRLNRYDARFIDNMNLRYIIHNIPLSASQNELWEKILLKYKKQFFKLNLNVNELILLEWKLPIINDAELNKQTSLKLIDDSIELRFNFNKDLIAEVRGIVYDDAEACLKKVGADIIDQSFKYDFKWDSTEKRWHGKFNIYLFKEVYNFAKRHDIIIDKSVTNLVAELNKSSSKWKPELRVLNNTLYINHLTESMLATIESFDFSDTSAYNIETISNKLGISPGPEYSNAQAMLMRASLLSKQTYKIRSENDIKVLLEYLGSRNTFVDYPGIQDDMLASISFDTTKPLDVLVTTLSSSEVIQKYPSNARDNLKVIRIS